MCVSIVVLVGPIVAAWGMEILISAICGVASSEACMIMCSKDIKDMLNLKKLREEIETDKKLIDILTTQEKTPLLIETDNENVEKVDILIETPDGIKIGFKREKTGEYRIISNKVSEELKEKQKKLINQIKQRYAYNIVKKELEKKGYGIVEEKKLEKNAIKIVARRWK